MMNRKSYKHYRGKYTGNYMEKVSHMGKNTNKHPVLKQTRPLKQELKQKLKQELKQPKQSKEIYQKLVSSVKYCLIDYDDTYWGIDLSTKTKICWNDIYNYYDPKHILEKIYKKYGLKFDNINDITFINLLLKHEIENIIYDKSKIYQPNIISIKYVTASNYITNILYKQSNMYQLYKLFIKLPFYSLNIDDWNETNLNITISIFRNLIIILDNLYKTVNKNNLEYLNNINTIHYKIINNIYWFSFCLSTQFSIYSDLNYLVYNNGIISIINTLCDSNLNLYCYETEYGETSNVLSYLIKELYWLNILKGGLIGNYKLSKNDLIQMIEKVLNTNRCYFSNYIYNAYKYADISIIDIIKTIPELIYPYVSNRAYWKRKQVLIGYYIINKYI